MDPALKIYNTDYERLKKDLLPIRNAGKKIVMCSGTFDLFHPGHMRLLAAAKSYGDILIVAVKSHEAAKLKKEDPPVWSEQFRMEAVANCINSDFVVLAKYDALTPLPQKFSYSNTSALEWLKIFTPVVKAIRPDVFVHEDNSAIAEARHQLFEAYNVQGIKNPRTEGVSTTMIIEEIQLRYLRKMQENHN